MATCDADIRPFLRQRLARQHAGDTLLLLEEFPLYGGDVRADIVAINGSLHGYEIKSAKDNLNRLASQVPAYGAVFDRASLVVSECHVDSVAKLVPDWWEILLVQCVGGGVCFKTRQRGRANPAREAHALVSLLWKAEALSILTLFGLDGGMKSASLSQMMDRLIDSVSVKELALLVRQKLRARGDWLAASRQRRHDEMSRLRATPGHRRRTLYGRSSGYIRRPS
jgi:hypothetical protein